MAHRISGPNSTILLSEGALQNGAAATHFAEALLGDLLGIREGVDRLSASQRHHLQGIWGESLLSSLWSLRSETDAGQVCEHLFHLGQELANLDKIELAASLFRRLSESAPNAALRERAQARLDTLLGSGSTLARTEFLGRRLAETSSDPSALFAMTLASSAFRLTRLGLLSRMAATPAWSVGLRPLAMSALANTAALGVEATAFTAGLRLGNSVLQRQQDWNPRSIGREFAGSALTLLSLRSLGAIGETAVARWVRGQNPASQLLRGLSPQLGMLSGILLSHRLEQALDLRPQLAGETLWTDALGTLIQFNVGGRISRNLLGEASLAAEAHVVQQGHALLREAIHSPHWSPLLQGSSALAGALWLSGCDSPSRTPGSLGFLLSMAFPLLGMAFTRRSGNDNILRILTDLQSHNMAEMRRPVADFTSYVIRGRPLSPSQFKTGVDRLLDVLQAPESEEGWEDAVDDQALDSLENVFSSEHVRAEHAQVFLEQLPEKNRQEDYFSLTLRLERHLAGKGNLLAPQYRALADFSLQALSQSNADGEVPLAAQEVLEALLRNPKVPEATLHSILYTRQLRGDDWRDLSTDTLVDALQNPELSKQWRNLLSQELCRVLGMGGDPLRAREINRIHQRLLTQVSPTETDHLPLLATLANLNSRLRVIPDTHLFRDIMVHFDNPRLNKDQRAAMIECIRQALESSPRLMAGYISALTATGMRNLTAALPVELNRFLLRTERDLDNSLDSIYYGAAHAIRDLAPHLPPNPMLHAALARRARLDPRPRIRDIARGLLRSIQSGGEN